MATGSLSALEDIITCSLCYDIYDRDKKAPKALPCTHNFCSECLDKYIKNHANASSLPCPLCQAKFPVPRGGAKVVPTNIVVKQLLDNLPQTFCKKMAVPVAKCQIHDKDDCNFVCKTCHVPLCHDCMKTITKGPHATHALDDAQDAIASLKADITKMKKSFKEVDAKSRAAYNSIRWEINLLKCERVTDVEQRADKIISEVMEWKSKTLKRITGCCEEARDELQEQEDELEPFKNEILEHIRCAQKDTDFVDTEKLSKTLDCVGRMVEEYISKVPQSKKVAMIQLLQGYALNLGDIDTCQYEVGSKTFEAPTLTTKGPLLTKTISHDLGFEYNNKIGLGNGSVLLSHNQKRCWTRCPVDGDTSKKIPEKPLPEGIMPSFRKYILSDGKVILKDFAGKGGTFLLNENLEPIKSFHRNYGFMIGLCDVDIIAYARETTATHQHEIHLYTADAHQKLICLVPPEGEEWSQWLSVCRCSTSGYLAIVDHDNSSLDIYNSLGLPEHHYSLNLQPFHHNAVSCNRRFIFIIQDNPYVVGIYNWEGRHLHDVDSSRLGLEGVPDMFLQAIESVGENLIVLAVGPAQCVRSLHYYELS